MPTSLRRMTKWLRRHFPTKTPIIVRVAKSLPGMHGVCLIGEGRALIRLASASEQMMKETLLEEYCHVLRFDTPVECKDDHDAIFWAILGEVTNRWRGE